MITPPTTPPSIIIDPVDISPDLNPPFNRLVATTAADPLADPDPEAARLPVTEGETSGVCGVMELVGAGTLLIDAAKLKGERPLES